MLANNVDPHQMPHHVASDQALHCLLMTLLPQGQNGLRKPHFILLQKKNNEILLLRHESRNKEQSIAN